jgi:SAM-dependent methyltransferase
VGQIRLTPSGLHVTLARVSASRLAWDHNAYYQRLLLSQLPRRCGRVLEVGCGAGAFAARLAGHAEHVDAVDQSAAMIEAAQRHTPANVTCIRADVMKLSLPAERYDAIVSITALHHLPLADALRHLAPALPGRCARRGGLAPDALAPGDDRRNGCRGGQSSVRRPVRGAQGDWPWRLVSTGVDP